MIGQCIPTGCFTKNKLFSIKKKNWPIFHLLALLPCHWPLLSTSLGLHQSCCRSWRCLLLAGRALSCLEQQSYIAPQLCWLPWVWTLYKANNIPRLVHEKCWRAPLNAYTTDEWTLSDIVSESINEWKLVTTGLLIGYFYKNFMNVWSPNKRMLKTQSGEGCGWATEIEEE